MHTLRHLQIACGILTTLAAGSPLRAVSATYNTIYSFNGSPDGSTPIAPLTAGDGIFYGTTTFGGRGGFGTVFSLTPPTAPGGAGTETVLHTFTHAEGFAPFGSVVIGTGGVLYGTTYVGGPSKSGTVFSLTPPAAGSAVWTLTTLHAFDGSPGGGSVDGGNPSSPIAIGKDGVLFGTTTYGGTHGVGIVFALTPPSSPGGEWTETVLHDFGGESGGILDGGEPIAGLLIGSDNTLYGTTFNGGTYGSGTVFSLKPPASPGAAWTETLLHTFTGGDDGGAPYYGGLIMDSAGVLYGTTETGGKQLTGTVFSLTPPSGAGSPWTESVLVNFIYRTGKLPLGGLVMDGEGNLYGTTSSGGTSSGGAGTVFRVTRPGPGGTWKVHVLHTFIYGSTGGETPYGGLAWNSGVLFGTTSGIDPFGGGDSGTVFSLALNP